MRVALEKVTEIVTDCRLSGETDSSSVSIFTGIKELKVRIKSRFGLFSFLIEGSIIMYSILCNDLEWFILGLEGWLSG
jgi:hypothetical protein